MSISVLFSIIYLLETHSMLSLYNQYETLAYVTDLIFHTTSGLYFMFNHLQQQ